MAIQKVYCSINVFNELYLAEESNVILEKIIEDFCDLYIDLESDEILQLKDENKIFKRIFKRENGTIKSAISEFEYIRTNSFMPFLNDVLILDKETDTDAIRKQFGILAVKPDEKQFLKNLGIQFGYSFKKEGKNEFSSWGDVFKNKTIEILNSAIIIDNFLWKNLGNFHNENLENLYNIFEYLIPRTLKIPFHLSIITSNNKGIFNKNFTEKLKKIVNNLKATTGVDIEISFSTHTDTVKDDIHERMILTNYHYIYSHKGFYVFENKRVKHSTNGYRNWIFKDVENYFGKSLKHIHYDNIVMAKKRIVENAGINNDVIFNLGNINNPLLN